MDLVKFQGNIIKKALYAVLDMEKSPYSIAYKIHFFYYFESMET